MSEMAYRILVSAYWYAYFVIGERYEQEDGPVTSMITEARLRLVADEPHVSKEEIHDIYSARWKYIADLEQQKNAIKGAA